MCVNFEYYLYVYRSCLWLLCYWPHADDYVKDRWGCFAMDEVFGSMPFGAIVGFIPLSNHIQSYPCFSIVIVPSPTPAAQRYQRKSSWCPTFALTTSSRRSQSLVAPLLWTSSRVSRNGQKSSAKKVNISCRDGFVFVVGGKVFFSGESFDPFVLIPEGSVVVTTTRCREASI